MNEAWEDPECDPNASIMQLQTRLELAIKALAEVGKQQIKITEQLNNVIIIANKIN